MRATAVAAAIAITILMIIVVPIVNGGGFAPRGRLELVAVDTEGRPLQGVVVTLIRQRELSPNVGSTTSPVVTGTDGEARFIGLSKGEYLVRCELSGYISETLGPLPIELVAASPRLPKTLRAVMNPGPYWY